MGESLERWVGVGGGVRGLLFSGGGLVGEGGRSNWVIGKGLGCAVPVARQTALR